MRKGFVFGKFMPFHKGHEAMINFALTVCDELTVLVCCSNKEEMPASLRISWIEETFAGNRKINIQLLEYDESFLPNTSVTSATVSALWAEKFKDLLPGHKVLVTSEPYGNLVADFMGIEHIPFNIGRDLVPVAASKIREDYKAYWNFLPASVKKHYITKVVLLGTESTGKTTLTSRLAAHFNAGSVLEAGRDLIADSNEFTLDDLYAVARAHADAINRASVADKPLVFIDTDIYITLSYGEFAFNEVLEIDDEIFTANKATLYLYLNNDVPYFQDGTRLSEADRNQLDFSHRWILEKYGVRYEEISGNWDERFEQAVKLVNELGW